MTPLEKMLTSFPGAYKRNEDDVYWTIDHSPHIDFWQCEDGHIAVKVWNNDPIEQVLAMGQPPLRVADLYSRTPGYVPVQREKPLDLLNFSDYLKLPHRALLAYGCRDGVIYRNKQGRRSLCVGMGGYCKPDGTPYSKVKVRLSLYGEGRFRWLLDTPGDPNIPCGLHRLDLARQAGYLIIGEGESDAYTLWFHGFPYLGISGADSWKRLDVSLLQGIPRILLIEEPDQVEKNQEHGQGFYANGRRHLRDGGYEGEIRTIRFKQVTHYKDPSNLHKACVRDSQGIDGLSQANEAEVRARFAEVMQKAIERAIPEGNQALDTQDDELPAGPPPAPVTESDRLQWFAELCAVPASVLSPAHKIVLMVILLHSPIWNVTEEYWWQVDARALAPLAGMSQKNFLSHLTYLTDNIGLFTKRHRKVWYTPEDAKHTKVRTELYIQPSAGSWRAYPSTIQVMAGAEERKHGGIQQPKPRCIYCGSEDLEAYDTYYCKQCHRSHTVEKGTASIYLALPEPVPVPVPVGVVDGSIALESERARAAEVSETGILQKTSENTLKTPNMGTIDSLSIYNPNPGKLLDLPEPEPEPEPPASDTSKKPKLGVLGVFPVADIAAEYAAIAGEAGIPIGEPHTCGCPLRYESHGYTMCHACDPHPQGLLTTEQWRRLKHVGKLHNGKKAWGSP